MRLLNVLLIGALGFGITACGSDESNEAPSQEATETQEVNKEETDKPANAPVVTGTIKGGAGKHIFLERLPLGERAYKTIDQATLPEDGSFTLRSDVEYLEFYRVRIEPSDAPQFENMANVIMQEGDRLTLEASQENVLRTYEISGNNFSENLRYMFADILFPYQQKLDTLTMQKGLLGNENSVNQEEIDQKIAQLKQDTDKQLIDLVNKDNKGPAAFLAYRRHLNDKMLSGGDITDEEIANLAGISNHLKNIMSQSFIVFEADVSVNNFRQAMEQKKAQAARDNFLPKGSMAPELAFADPSGKVRKLSDLRGKVVLIDFWASWCGPCRKASPDIVKLYDEYHDKGFEILSVSLDNNKQKWEYAIKADELKWPYHISDLKGWQSQAASLYNVTSIPHAVLVDREGKIVAKGQEIGININAPDPTALLKQQLNKIFGS